MADPTWIRFNDLPAVVRDRLARHFCDEPPYPVLLRKVASPYVRKIGWSILLVWGAAFLWSLVDGGFGDLDSHLALQARQGLTNYYVALFMIGLGLLGLIRCYFRDRLPYLPGEYLTPTALIIVEDDWLRIHQLSSPDLVEYKVPADVDIREGIVVNLGRAGIWAAPCDEQTGRLVEAMVHVTRDPCQRGPRHLTDIIDLLSDTTDAEAETQRDPSCRPVAPRAPALPFLLRWISPLAIVSAWLLARQIVPARDQASDEAMFLTALAADSVEVWQHYLGRGGARSPEVRDEFLPAAELREEQSTISFAKLVWFRNRFPEGSRPAMRAEAVLRAFFPRKRVELAAAIRQLDPDRRAIFEALISRVEKTRDGRIEVNVLRPDVRDLESFDAECSLKGRIVGPGGVRAHLAHELGSEAIKPPTRQTRNEYYIHDVAPSLTDDHVDGWGPSLTASVRSPFEVNLLWGLLSPVVNLWPASTHPEPAQLPQLTLRIRLLRSSTYYILPDDPLLRGRDQHGDRVGVGHPGEYMGPRFVFEGEFRVPGHAAPLAFSVTVDPPPSFNINCPALEKFKADGTVAPIPTEDIYSALAAHALEELSASIVTAFFEGRHVSPGNRDPDR